MHEAEEPGEGIFGCVLDSVPCAAELLSNATVGHLHAVLGHFGFFGGKPLGVVWPRRKQEEGTNGNDNRGGTLNDEEPLPRMKTKSPLHVGEDTSSQEARQDV